MRSITYEQADLLKKNGIEIPESELVGWWVHFYGNYQKTQERKIENKWDFVDLKGKPLISKYDISIPTTDLEGLWNMLPRYVDRCELNLTPTWMGKVKVYYFKHPTIPSMEHEDPKQAIIDMLVHLKKKGLM